MSGAGAEKRMHGAGGEKRLLEGERPAAVRMMMMQIVLAD